MGSTRFPHGDRLPTGAPDDSHEVLLTRSRNPGPFWRKWLPTDFRPTALRISLYPDRIACLRVAMQFVDATVVWIAKSQFSGSTRGRFLQVMDDQPPNWSVSSLQLEFRVFNGCKEWTGRACRSSCLVRWARSKVQVHGCSPEGSPRAARLYSAHNITSVSLSGLSPRAFTSCCVCSKR
jgi:hypothetical protein